MNSKETETTKDKTRCHGFSGIPEDFNRTMKMMGKCCPDIDQIPDCAEMMKGIMEKCCGLKPDNSKASS